MKPLKKKKTVADYDALPEGSPYQLIEGELIKSPTPEIQHQLTSGNLVYKLYMSIDKEGE